MFGVAVNHFQKPSHPQSVNEATRFATALLKSCPEVTTIVVVDGSESRSKELERYCNELDVCYIHIGRSMSFAEAYNIGVAQLTEEWVTTMASDVFVYPDTFTHFKNFIDTHSHLAIGCLIPYLSNSDYVLQRAIRTSELRSCQSGIMTYNLNIFPKAVFERLGGLSERYSGNFNDVESSLSLKLMGLDVFLVDAYALHYGRLTLQHGTNVNAQADWDTFHQSHPELLGDKSLYQVKVDYFYKHPLIKTVWRLSNKFRPRRFRRHLEAWVYNNIPKLQGTDARR